MYKTKSGFTIVELLIVIVVIGILAAISIVAYNGIQDRSKNAQTAQALGTWLKGLQLYKADNGRWINAYTCLGEGYLYGPTGTATSGTAQCRQSSVSDVAVENSTFKTTMKQYLGGTLPNPAFVTARNTDTHWYRGITYLYGGGAGTDVYIQAVFAGSISCPSVGGFTGSASVFGGNTQCYYAIGQTTDT